MRKLVLVAGVVSRCWSPTCSPGRCRSIRSRGRRRHSTGYAGVHARNERLADVQLVSIAPEIGPEHIEFGPDGRLYTGALSGAVLRMNRRRQRAAEVVARTGGRPLGLEFDADGQLVIADALRGLLAVDAAGTGARADRQRSTARRSCTRTRWSWRADGRMLFTDATQRISPRDSARSTPRCSTSSSTPAPAACSSSIRPQPRRASSRRGCAFPNGVALSADEQSTAGRRDRHVSHPEDRARRRGRRCRRRLAHASRRRRGAARQPARLSRQPHARRGRPLLDGLHQAAQRGHRLRCRASRGCAR